MKTVSVVDLISGLVVQRDGDTLTLDVPADLDRLTGGVAVDADSLGDYLAPGGARHVYGARPMRLAARRPGEECLVADDEIAAGGHRAVRRYRLSEIEPRVTERKPQPQGGAPA